MDIPAEVLEVLKCSSCELYLSRGPVYLQHDGAAACGRCYTPKRPAARNTQYEATAKLLKFPCKNWELGCLETVPYVEQNEMIDHEEVCEHRLYVCPVLGSAHCDWLGTRTKILQHCQTEHPDTVVDNSATLIHDISKASVRTYLLRAFQLLFLLHAKVCLVSGKIFHSLRLLGASDEAAKYFFILDIKRNNEQVTKEGQVAPQGCLAIQEPTSLAVNTNSLLDMLDGFNGTTFTVTVKRRENNAAEQLAIVMNQRKSHADNQPARVVERCAPCSRKVTVFRYRGKDGWRCERCTPARRACENKCQGCTHTDIKKKCRKHEDFFCQQRTNCIICKASVFRSSLAAHYGYGHITHSAGSTWRATRTGKQDQRYLVSSVAGTIVCRYTLLDSCFDLFVHIPVSSERLSEYRCEVRVTDPATGHSRTFTPDVNYDTWHDWQIVVKKTEFSRWNTELDVCVDIKKVES